MSFGSSAAGPQAPAAARAGAASLRLPDLWFAVLVALLAAAATLALERGQAFDPLIRFSDTDDALRLAQVRSFLASGAWFAPRIESLGDGAGLASHWSRLVDLPIAGLILASGPFLGAAGAERFALMLWPKLTLIGCVAPLAWLLAREASREAALAFAGMLFLSLFTLFQFQLVRIDHHNVQNACAIVAIALATSPLARGRMGLAAGLIAGLGLAVGYEALPAAGATAAGLAVLALFDPARRRVAEGFATGLALSLAAALVLTVRPTDWLAVPCDALGLNVVAGAAVGCLALLAAHRAKGSLPRRFGALGLAGAAAFAAFAAIEPACLAGPFAKVDPAMGPLWLDHVQEAKSVLSLIGGKTELAVAAILSLGACLAVQAAVAWQTRRGTDLLRLGLLLLLTAIGFRHLKMIPYAQLLGLYCLASACFAARLSSPHLKPRIAALLAMLLLTPVPILILQSLVAPATVAAEEAAGRKRCNAEPHFAALAALPRARILPQPDLGGMLALIGHHRTMLGNYHRLDREIARGHAIFAAPVAEARALLGDWRIDLIAVCDGKPIRKQPGAAGSLALAIERGEGLPDWLIPIAMGPDTDVKAWRVARP